MEVTYDLAGVREVMMHVRPTVVTKTDDEGSNWPVVGL